MCRTFFQIITKVTSKTIMAESPILREVEKMIDNYQTTIQAIDSFIHFLTWNVKDKSFHHDASSSIGRRMTTSDLNRISANEDVTPDIVVQYNSTLGYVSEVKNNLPRNQQWWRTVVEQLEKYDDNLMGWWTDDEYISTSCLVLLIHKSRSRIFRDYLEQVINKESITFVQPASIIEYDRSNQVQPFIFLRTEWGDILDATISEALYYGTSIPIEKLFASGSDRKFYDSPPPVEHTMSILWQHIFNQMKSDDDLDKDRNVYFLSISLDEITHGLQKSYGSEGHKERDVTFPKRKSVRDAMDAFVSIGLAERSDDDTYTVHYRRLQKPLNKFCKQREKSKDVDNTIFEQLELDY